MAAALRCPNGIAAAQKAGDLHAAGEMEAFLDSL